jgi:glycosyltransferase involved in cell wall biosynthesis
LKALFIHDHKFVVDEKKNIYSKGQFPYSVWDRYLHHFDELIVVARSQSLERQQLNRLNLSSGKNVQFVFLPNLASPLGLIRHLFEVKKKLSEIISSVDAVIARTSLLSKIAYPIAEKTKTPWAAEVVGCSWDAYWNYGSVKAKILAPFVFYSQREMLKKAPFAIYVTQEFLQKRYPSGGTSTGVSDVELSYSDELVLSARKDKVLHPSKPFVFGLIGSLSSKYKGIQTAFSALQKIKNQLPNFELQILGAGDQTHWMRQAEYLGLSDNVRFLGTLPAGRAVLEYLDHVDVYLQPSLTEGLPRSLAEAMSRACPAIGSNVGGIPELLDAAVLHKPGDIDHLSKLIVKSLDARWRSDQAKKNFETSKLYTCDVLNAKRDAFWASFAQYAREQSNR